MKKKDILYVKNSSRLVPFINNLNDIKSKIEELQFAKEYHTGLANLYRAISFFTQKARKEHEHNLEMKATEAIPNQKKSVFE